MEIGFWRMKTAVLIIGLLIIAFVVLLIYSNRTEKYEIVYSALLHPTKENIKIPAGAICYSNEELRDIIGGQKIPELTKMLDLDLDSHDLFACIIAKHTIVRVVGRGDLGFIMLSTNLVEGTCVAVVKGQKRRLFQFHYPDAKGQNRGVR